MNEVANFWWLFGVTGVVFMLLGREMHRNRNKAWKLAMNLSTVNMFWFWFLLLVKVGL